MEANVSFKTFGEMLKHLRQRAQLTQDELGIAVGYSRAHIARLESNQRLPDAGAVKARFFEPLDLKPDSAEAALLVKLAQSARAMPLLIEEHEEAPTSIPNNLPYELTSFIGREGALTELERLLPTTRLLTLTGTGGTGKTRLALKLAERVMPSYPDGMWLVELAPLTDAAQVPAATLSALALRELPDKTSITSLITHLQDKRALLILDNCEHVIEACAQLADALLRGCRHLRVLTTSREALGIAGELAWRVPSLHVPDAQTADLVALQHSEAVALFVERATFASSTFKLTAENAPATLHICTRLDGIPLAIELAAARVKALTPANIAARLDDRFRLLAGGSRTALPRQQTLQAAVDWSYRLLSEQERLLLSRLAVFTGGWTLAAADHVCAGEGIERADVLELLTRLVDKSLVAVDDAGVETRYFLLETIRQYAIEKLNAGDEAKTMRDRHLDYFLVLRDQVFDELSGNNAKDQIGMVKRLGSDIDNIRQAIRWSLDTERADAAHKLVDGYYHVFIAHAGENELLSWWLLMSETPSMDPHLQADALFGAGEIYGRTGRHEKELECIQRTKAKAEALNDQRLVAFAMGWLSNSALNRKQYDQARIYGDAYIELSSRFKFLSDAQIESFRGSMSGMLAMAEGNHASAITCFKFGYDYAHQTGHKMSSSGAARMLGYAHLFAGDPESASNYFRESMIDNHAFNDRLAVSACLFAFGTLAEKTGDMSRATRLFGAAVKVRTSAGLPNLPWDVDMYQPSLTAVQSQLHQPELAAMWAKGEAMTLEQAMAFALDE
jgi:predicted ATPase